MITKNREPGTVDQLAEKDLTNYQTFIEEYNNKRLGSQQNVKPAVFKRNQTTNKTSKECKGSNAEQYLQKVKQQRPADKAHTALTGTGIDIR